VCVQQKDQKIITDPVSATSDTTVSSSDTTPYLCSHSSKEEIEGKSKWENATEKHYGMSKCG